MRIGFGVWVAGYAIACVWFAACAAAPLGEDDFEKSKASVAVEGEHIQFVLEPKLAKMQGLELRSNRLIELQVHPEAVAIARSFVNARDEEGRAEQRSEDASPQDAKCVVSVLQLQVGFALRGIAFPELFQMELSLASSSVASVWENVRFLNEQASPFENFWLGGRHMGWANPIDALLGRLPDAAPYLAIERSQRIRQRRPVRPIVQRVALSTESGDPAIRNNWSDAGKTHVYALPPHDVACLEAERRICWRVRDDAVEERDASQLTSKNAGWSCWGGDVEGGGGPRGGGEPLPENVTPLRDYSTPRMHRWPARVPNAA